MSKLLSVCMIVKDEERVLERCLESIHGIADEIVVVDTGSIDKTKEITARYTDKLYDFEWVNDFSKARNYSASKATGKWILVIDADEYVDRESFKKFKDDLQINPPKRDINAVEIINFVGASKSTAKNYHTRLYKNDGKIKFYRPIHELLQYEDGEGEVGLADLQIYHSGYMRYTVEEKNKHERNLSILLAQAEKKGIDYFYIGNEYRSLGELEKAILYYQKSYRERESTTATYITKLLVYLIDTLFREKRYNEALEVIKGCEEAYPNYADYKYYKGLIFYTQKDYNKAKAIFENILANKNNLVVDHSEEYKEYSPLIHLAEIYEQEEELQKAVEYYSRAISLNESNDALWSRLLFLLGKHSPLEELTGFINRKVVPSYGMNEQRMIKILLNVPLLNVQKLSRSLLDNEKLADIENEALLMKNLMLDLNFEEVHEMIEEKTLGEITVILQTNIFTISDLFIQIHEREGENNKENSEKLARLNGIENIIPLLFSERHKKIKLNKAEGSLFVNIYRQAAVMELHQIIKKLDSKLFLLDKSLKEEVELIRNL